MVNEKRRIEDMDFSIIIITTNNNECRRSTLTYDDIEWDQLMNLHKNLK